VVRPYDVIGRYGGEEFLVIGEGGDTASAFNVAEKIRARTSERAVDSLERKIPVTLSLG
jgi:two-component system, cell cycle response regulator